MPFLLREHFKIWLEKNKRCLVWVLKKHACYITTLDIDNQAEGQVQIDRCGIHIKHRGRGKRSSHCIAILWSRLQYFHLADSPSSLFSTIVHLLWLTICFVWSKASLYLQVVKRTYLTIIDLYEPRYNLIIITNSSVLNSWLTMISYHSGLPNVSDFD